VLCVAHLVVLYAGSQVSEVNNVSHKFATYSDGEHLIDVSVENDALPVWRRHEPIPERNGLECIVDHDYEIALLRGSDWKPLVWNALENISYRGSTKCIPNISIAIEPILGRVSIRSKKYTFRDGPS
jgi:hypothetical protein